MFPQSSDLLPPVTIHDAVSDLPAPSMEKDDNDRQLHYLSPPQNEFQAFVRGRRSTGEQAREGSTSEATVTEHCSRLARESEIAQRKPLRSFNIPAPTVTGKPTVTLLLDARVNRTTPRIPTIREVARFQCLFLTVLLHDNNTANTCACTAFPDDWSFAGNTKSRYQQIGVCSSTSSSLCVPVFSLTLIVPQNAVPVLLGRALGLELARVLRPTASSSSRDKEEDEENTSM